MKKEILTEEKVKQRWQQMKEMDKIWNNLSEREKISCSFCDFSSSISSVTVVSC